MPPLNVAKKPEKEKVPLGWCRVCGATVWPSSGLIVILPAPHGGFGVVVSVCFGDCQNELGDALKRGLATIPTPPDTARQNFYARREKARAKRAAA